MEQAGADVVISPDPDLIVSTDYLVLPGVGAFEAGMNGLRKAGVIEALREFVYRGKPLLGICIGMQMLLDRSEEDGNHQGLGIIPGSVEKIPQMEEGRLVRKIPHIGWGALRDSSLQRDWKASLLSNIHEGEFFYFVHSFMAVPENNMYLLATVEYEGVHITAAIQKENVTGLQFHPEKSGELGLRILRNFLSSRMV